MCIRDRGSTALLMTGLVVTGNAQGEGLGLSYLLAAGCLFTNGSFIKDVPYDPNFYFYGEEISLMLRAFTRGYSIFHLPNVPIFHLYTDPVNAPRKLHWNAEEDMHRPTKWNELEKISIENNVAVINFENSEIRGSIFSSVKVCT